jgi:energy-coupling factor transporter transmembrane protein EcfT
MVCAVVISHGSISLFVVFTLLGIVAFEKIRRLNLGIGVVLFSFALVLWVSWWLYNANFTLEQAVRLVTYVFGSPEESKITRNIFALNDPLPPIGVFLRNFYLKPLLLLIGLMSMVVAFRERRSRSVSFYTGALCGCVIASVAMLGLSSASAPGGSNIEVTEILLFTLLPACCLASRMLKRSDRAFQLGAVIIILLVVPSFLTMFTYTSEYAEKTHPWEVNGYQFLSAHVPTTSVIGTDELTSIALRFYDTAYSPHAGVLTLSETNMTSWVKERPTFFSGQYILRSFRQELSYASHGTFEERHQFWALVDSNIAASANRNRAYDDGYMQLYWYNSG